ncbi:hypothetical protein ACH5RR_041259 [Cinchona calisaya]|uniref:Protein kinase domain-containing protein n=1 Tax=Cinchona calisaya TaxID=153742 RepID=A0ABD2XYB2_9GENT
MAHQRTFRLLMEYAYTTKVNVKSDIYSFGVLLLELSTGRAPVIADEQISLIEWSWKQYEEKNAMTNALDEDIKETNYLETMIAMFKLGLKCTSPSPSQMPSMNEILQILLSCLTNFSSSEETSTVISFHQNSARW